MKTGGFQQMIRYKNFFLLLSRAPGSGSFQRHSLTYEIAPARLANPAKVGSVSQSEGVAKRNSPKFSKRWVALRSTHPTATFDFK
ncbi:Uncharacterized protein dnm_000830 [Desulfonema magnum]|uniref:Uncharacterized protein n=1 Tax=Desulfonema magnum TaxID=45655 RepID=A0A975GK35_9BACT|nr:Uncharacterized protein dnm_000830 [Desulfonema magnum]